MVGTRSSEEHTLTLWPESKGGEGEGRGEGGANRTRGRDDKRLEQEVLLWGGSQSCEWAL